jgi:type VI secretion system secreted protein Hcp
MSVQMFLKLDQILGESTDAHHPGEIEILGWSWGLSEPAGPAAGGGGGRVAVRNITIQKLVDLSSPVLLKHGAEGRAISTGAVTTRRSGANGAEFLFFKMTEVFVTSVAVVASDNANQPTETVTLAFRTFAFDYRPTLPTGSLGPEETFRWDILRNQEF